MTLCQTESERIFGDANGPQKFTFGGREYSCVFNLTEDTFVIADAGRQVQQTALLSANLAQFAGYPRPAKDGIVTVNGKDYRVVSVNAESGCIQLNLGEENE